jgi:predicted alpha-1,2-mannosidase
MAKALGKIDDYDLFSKRALFYRNLFDKSTGLMRGRNSDGTWAIPFDTLKISHAGDAGGDYTEGNAWQYTWFVPQNSKDLIALIGGDEAFVSRLDKFFTMESKVYGAGFTGDVTGLIGQYAHGNEPCHHVAYLYNYAGQPWKTQARVRQIATTLYTGTPGGLCGNDDCGQMSAWYVFTALGFYPVNPASGVYVIGSPLVDKAVIKLDPNYYPGRAFTLEAKNNSAENIYVQSATLNGQPLNRSWISHEEIVHGGKLVLVMGPTPNRTWATAQANRPTQELKPKI